MKSENKYIQLMQDSTFNSLFYISIAIVFFVSFFITIKLVYESGISEGFDTGFAAAQNRVYVILGSIENHHGYLLILIFSFIIINTAIDYIIYSILKLFNKKYYLQNEEEETKRRK